MPNKTIQALSSHVLSKFPEAKIVTTTKLSPPTVFVDPHPLAIYAAFLSNILWPKAKFLSIIGLYGCG